MSTFSMTAEQLAPFLGEHVEAAAKRALVGAANRIVQIIVTEIIPAEPRQPVDRSLYRAGWRAKPTGEGAEIENTLPYASIIEYGARAENIKVGKPMIDALEEWVTRKRLDLKGRTARELAWAIAMAMQKKGIYNGGKGLRILEKALERLPDVLAEEFAHELEREFG